MAGLFAAIRAGDRGEVSRILADPGNSRLVNNPSDYNETPLHLAAEMGDIVICQSLLAAGARCDVSNAQRHSPLHRAAFKGHHKVIQLLLKHGARSIVDRRDSRGCTALHFASDRLGNYECVKLLCDYDADFNIKNNDGLTPHQTAKRANKREIANYLQRKINKLRSRPFGEMNWYEDQIIEAYKQVMDVEQWPDPRVRIATIGDRGSGKTSVRKVLFETNFNPNEDPTHVAYIESSLAPVRLKQRRGWKLSRTADKDAENVRQALEDYITVKIFQYMRKKRIAQRADNSTLESTPSSTGSNMHSTESGHRRPSSALPISEGVHTDYLVVEIPAPKLDRAMTGSPDSTSLLFQPQDYTSYDMSATFSEKLQEAVPLSQLQNIFKWWPKRNSIKELPPLEPVTGIQSCYSKPPLQASDCFMSVSEFCGEPSLICLMPLMFSPNWVYLLTYNLQLSPDKPVESWKRASITTCDGDVLSNTGVLVEWMCTAIATAGVRNELYVPVTLSSDHSHLPVMLLVGTNTCNSDASTSLDVCKHIKALAPSAGVHFNQLEAAQTRKEVVMVKVSCDLEEERRQEQYVGFSHLRRELELNACRNMCTFAQNIPLIWTAVYLHLKHVQKDRKKSFIFLHQLQHNLCEESQVSVEVPTLQVALKYFHSLGLLCYFHQHQQLKEIVFLQPQAFLEALSSIMVLHRNWSVEKKNADYIECLKSGIMKRNLLFLIYDSGKHLLDFNVCLFVLDALNILCIHPILNSNPQKPCYIVPCLVQSTYRNVFFPSQANKDETEWLMFEAEGMPFPWAVYNQLVTCCSRAFVTFLPKLWQGVSHFQLTNYLHLVLVHDTSSIVFRVERNSSQCESCITLPETDEQRPPGSVCSQCKKPCEPHMLGQGISPLCSECGVLPTGPTAADSGVCYVEWKGTIKTGLTADELPNVLNKVKKSSNSCSQCVHSLSFPVHERALSSVCPDTLRFLCSQLACVKDCWFPGLRYTLKTKHWKGSVQCDKKWRNSVVMEDLPAGLRCWWK